MNENSLNNLDKHINELIISDHQHYIDSINYMNNSNFNDIYHEDGTVTTKAERISILENKINELTQIWKNPYTRLTINDINWIYNINFDSYVLNIKNKFSLLNF